MENLMNKLVFTELGRGVIVATFQDGSVCVRLDHGGGAILMPHQVFAPPAQKTARNLREVYSKAG